MFKVQKIIGEEKLEVFPSNNVYPVLELGMYEIHYTSDNIVSDVVFLEDIPIDSTRVEIDGNNIYIFPFRYFEDYFGYANLSINGESFLFNIKIEKLKLSEIEDIFVYLWDKEEKLLNLFFSKSTYEINFKKKGADLGQTSKLISFLDIFILTFEKLYFYFETMPHTVLREFNKKTKYNSCNITGDTIAWLLHNLDEIQFDESFKGHFDAIGINNQHGLIDNINTTENKNSFDNYENQIILGSFVIVLKKLTQLKKEITSNIDIRTESKEYYADFRDLKRIPFIRLFNSSIALEKKTFKLYRKYKSLFAEVPPKSNKPVLTPVFAQKHHYRKAFSLIKHLNDYKFNLSGEFNLLNINRLSSLYEVYNLYMIIDFLKKKLKLDLFAISATSNRGDNIIERLAFNNNNCQITLFYECKFYGRTTIDQPTKLRRIDTLNGSYYNPDFVLEILNKESGRIKYYVFDAKYSKQQTVKNLHLPSLIQKYIINTGIENSPNFKINSLNLIFPGEKGIKIIESNYFEPTIRLIASKPNIEQELEDYIAEILNKDVPPNLVFK